VEVVVAVAVWGGVAVGGSVGAMVAVAVEVGRGLEVMAGLGWHATIMRLNRMERSRTGIFKIEPLSLQ